MSKNEVQFIRRGASVFTPDGELHEKHKSISKARRWSRLFQAKNGGVGCGSVRHEPSPEQLRAIRTLAKAELLRLKTERTRLDLAPKKIGKIKEELSVPFVQGGTNDASIRHNQRYKARGAGRG